MIPAITRLTSSVVLSVRRHLQLRLGLLPSHQPTLPLVSGPGSYAVQSMPRPWPRQLRDRQQQQQLLQQRLQCPHQKRSYQRRASVFTSPPPVVLQHIPPGEQQSCRNLYVVRQASRSCPRLTAAHASGCASHLSNLCLSFLQPREAVKRRSSKHPFRALAAPSSSISSQRVWPIRRAICAQQSVCAARARLQPLQLQTLSVRHSRRLSPLTLSWHRCKHIR